MQYAVRVTVGDALQHLEQVGLDEAEREAALALIQLHVLLEVLVEELEDEKELVVLVYDVEQLDDVEVVELLEQRDLAYGRARHAVRLRVEADALERDHGAARVVLGLVHHAVRALADLLDAREVLDSACSRMNVVCTIRQYSKYSKVRVFSIVVVLRVHFSIN